jgi:hypothetical protein
MTRSNDIRVLVDHHDPVLAAGVAATLQVAGRFAITRGNGSPATTSSWIREFPGSGVVVADYDAGLRYAGEEGLVGTILILTHHEDVAHIRPAIEQGIRGYP